MDWMELKRLEDEERERAERANHPAAQAGRVQPAHDTARAGAFGASGRIPGLLDGLNAPQRAAVTHTDGPLLILAGPGSGKTRVITRRIAWLVAEAGLSPWEVVAITFTNKAAREMKERVEKLLPVSGLWISTFHAMCARILRREIELLPGYTRDFTIYDTSDRNTLIKSILKELNIDATRFKPSAVGGWISDWKNKGYAIDRPELDMQADGEDDASVEREVFVAVRKRYEEAMRSSNALDFDDLLLKVLELFEKHLGLRDAYARRFRHVMVDEYQDTNRVQYLLTKHLASYHGNLAVCGDPDQSIYGWRGADIRNILDFEQDFPSAKVVSLEQNYRSTGYILKAAESVIRHNAGRSGKRIWSDKGDGEKIAVLECADEEDEAREVAQQIRSLQARGTRLDRVAIFYRVNFMQRALESALRLARVPYQIVGGVEFYERREIRDLIAYLKLCVNPQDDVAFLRVVNTPARGVGEKSLGDLRNWALDRRVPLSRALQSDEALSAIKGRAKTGLLAFRELLVALEPLRDVDAAVALDQVLEKIEVERWLAEMDDQQGVDREANIEELRAHAAAYDRMAAEMKRLIAETPVGERGAELVQAIATAQPTLFTAPPGGALAAETPLGGLRGFLQEIALVSDTDAIEGDQGKVTLMTLHSAKGLEYEAVFLCGVEEELLPHARALAEHVGEEDGVEEERRLFYVGITRAEKRLVLTHCQQRLHFGQTNFCRPSRFLEELPPEVLEGGASTAGGDDDALGAYEPATKEAALKVGDRGEHDHFGRGTIEQLQGSGVNARAIVRFPAHGTKTLLLQYAKLSVIGR
ncbi:MAG: UvrD-helicase domain-containing protein [Planctomycetes bacterium]|nr:UvrD-helicase domain-containing protein [Planctomycetota bacterium]